MTPSTPPSKYRALCAPIIARVLQETAGLPAREVQARLRAAYPFGARVNQPYKIWREEIRRQGGPRLIAGRPPKPSAAPRPESAPNPKSKIQNPKSEAPPQMAASLPSRLVVLTDEPDLPPRFLFGCRTCAHLGALRAVTDARGARRLRRHCPRSPLGWTDIDWPACPHYQARGNPPMAAVSIPTAQPKGDSP